MSTVGYKAKRIGRPPGWLGVSRIVDVEPADSSINQGEFQGGESGTLRIIAVYSVDWP